MPKTVKSKRLLAKKTTVWQDLARKADSSPGRLTILLLIAIVVASGLVINNRVNQDRYGDARKTADTFLNAYANCDINTAKKYYLPLQNDSSQAQNYLNSCRRYELSFSFDHRQSAQTTNKKGTLAKNVSYIYNYRDSRNGSGQIWIYMIWSKELGQWYIFSITPTKLTPTN